MARKRGPMKQKIGDALEVVLQLIVQVAEKILGPKTTHIETSLQEMLLQGHHDLEFAGGCGKRRLAFQTRGDLLIARLALSPEAIAGDCLQDALRWQEEVILEVEKLDLEYPVKFAIVEDQGHSVNPLSIKSTNNMGTLAGG